MFTNTNDFDKFERVTVNEASLAYMAGEDFFRNWGGNEQKPSVVSIREFIYKIYPTFFLQGIQYNDVYYTMGADGTVLNPSSLISHCPSSFTRMRVSMLVRRMKDNNSWNLNDADIANIVVTCAADFSDDYDDFFPYVVRIFTGNELKREVYRTVFDGKPVKFAVYDFVEPQASAQAIIASKLLDVEETNVAAQEINVVDDTSVALYALAGNPGVNVRQFFELMPPHLLSPVLRAMNDNRGHIGISLGAVWSHPGGHVDKIVIRALFPFEWDTNNNNPARTYDPFVRYKTDTGSYLRNGETPQSIMVHWLGHRFRRRLHGLV